MKNLVLGLLAASSFFVIDLSTESVSAAPNAYRQTYSTQPRYSRYAYYYNPVTIPCAKFSWGRFDLEGKDGEQYSLMKVASLKENLDDIPESAFPKAAKMPVVPESENAIMIKPIDVKSLPDDFELKDILAAPKKP